MQGVPLADESETTIVPFESNDVGDYGDNSSKKLVTAIVIGGGERGFTYSQYALDFPDELKIVAVAEPQKHR